GCSRAGRRDRPQGAGRLDHWSDAASAAPPGTVSRHAHPLRRAQIPRPLPHAIASSRVRTLDVMNERYIDEWAAGIRCSPGRWHFGCHGQRRDRRRHMDDETAIEIGWWGEVDEEVGAVLRNGPQSTQDLARRL